MATLAECERAVAALRDRLADVEPELRRKYAVERTVVCRVRDLDAVLLGRFDDDGALRDVRTADSGTAQVKLTTTSDDLIALLEGRLAVPTAWATGRLKIEASVLDLLKLRSLLY